MNDVNFIPQIIKQCDDISKELKKFSALYKIDLENIGFEILKISTFLHYPNGKKELLEEHNIHFLEDDEYYNLADFEISQSFDIKILPKIKVPDVSLKFSERNDRAFLYFYQDDSLQNNPEFFDKIISLAEGLLALHKAILRNRRAKRILIIKQIKEKIRHKTPYPLSITIDESTFYTPPKPPYFVFVPKEECKDKEQYKDHKKEFEDAFFAVDKNDPILKYYPATPSKPGRDIFGKFIKGDHTDLTDLEIPLFEREDAMLEDRGECIWIKALIPSFVQYKDHAILFFKQEHLDNVSIYNTPLLLGGEEKQVRLEILATNPLKDAIESGMILEAKEIFVKGNIAQDVILRAKKLQIEGQTHQSTQIIAQDAKILLHKGHLVAKNAEVGSLESGSIEAEKIEAKYCNGSRITGSEIKIIELENNNKITFNHRLYLENISGRQNEIIFYAFANGRLKELEQELLAKKENVTNTSKEIFAKYQKITEFLSKYQSTIEQIKTSEHNIQTQMLQNKQIHNIVQRYGLAIKESEKLKKELSDIESHLKEISSDLEKLDDEVLEAEAYCSKSWGTNTQLCYQREYPKKTLKSFGVNADFAGNYCLDKNTQEFVRIG
ncbi:multidrug resistance protein [Helicobacter mustelae]|uniref:FapA family protein n=1 Tax=Helicobacter mustelae TaxID=217 RepID=UPI000E061AB6|nr:FapA family protein [Helicobacter mustelae]STP12316.1 multidrug resistance protein [Helicobacter mustelae]